jgi:hypothetical protein
VRATEQFAHRKSSPHARQRSVGEKPRRFRRRIACSPRANVSSRISRVR